MYWSRMLHDFILGAMLGDKESEDWALAMLWPGLEGETGQSGAQMQLASAPAVAPSPEYEGEPMAAQGEPAGPPSLGRLRLELPGTSRAGAGQDLAPSGEPGVLPRLRLRLPGEPPAPGRGELSLGLPGAAPRERESRAASAAGPEGAERRWWEHETRVEKRYHWHLERGRSPEQARQLVEQERPVLDRDDIANPWLYLDYARSLPGQALRKGGYVKAWDEMSDPENMLLSFLVSQGLSPAKAQRRATQASYLLEPGGPADLKAWLKYLGTLGPSMFDKEGYLKQPGTFTQDVNNVVSGVVYDTGVSGKVAAARVEEALRAHRMMMALHRHPEEGQAHGTPLLLTPEYVTGSHEEKLEQIKALFGCSDEDAELIRIHLQNVLQGLPPDATPEEMEAARRRREQRAWEEEVAYIQREREQQAIESMRGTAGAMDFLGGFAPPGLSHALDMASDAMKEEAERRERRWRRQAPPTRPIQRVPIGLAKPDYGQAAEEYERRLYRERYGEPPPREPIRFQQIDELGPMEAARRWLEEDYTRKAIRNMLRHHTYPDGSKLSDEEIANIMSSL